MTPPVVRRGRLVMHPATSAGSLTRDHTARCRVLVAPVEELWTLPASLHRLVLATQEAGNVTGHITSGSRALHALLPDVDHADDERRQHDHDGGAREPVLADRVGCGLAEVVREQPEADRPHDAAGGVPEEKPPPRHVRDPG